MRRRNLPDKRFLSYDQNDTSCVVFILFLVGMKVIQPHDIPRCSGSVPLFRIKKTEELISPHQRIDVNTINSCCHMQHSHRYPYLLDTYLDTCSLLEIISMDLLVLKSLMIPFESRIGL